MSKKSYSFAIAASVAAHLTVAGFLVFSITSKPLVLSAPASAPIEEVKTIDAVMIDEQALNQEVARLENIEKEKKRKEQLEQQKIEKERRALALKRKQEQDQLAQLKAEKAELEKQKKLDKIAAIERQAKIKLEQERLEKLEEEKKQALEAKQKVQEERKAAELAQKKAQEEERKAIELAKKREKELQEKLAQERKEQALIAENQRKAELTNLVKNQVHQYAALMQSIIHQNWRQPLGISLAGKKCVLSVRLSASGEVLEARVIETSGSKEYDRSTELAVMKSSPLPMPSEPTAKEKFEQFTFTFNPESA